MRRSPSVWIVLVISVILTAGSTVASVGELIPFFRSSGTLETKFDALSSGTLAPGLSTYSKLAFLDDCSYALNSFSFIMLGENTQTSIRQNCESVASSIVVTAPTFSYAWYVKALAGDAVNGSGDFQTSLLQARRTAPNQEGLAYYRAMLAYTNWQYLDNEARQELSGDIVVAANSSRGRSWIARRYLEGGEFQATIVDAMEMAPPNIQSLFLRTVRNFSG